MRNVLFLLILIFASSCKFNYSTNVEWIEVLSPKAGFKVKCPQKLNVLDNISVKFDEKNVDKHGFLSCRSQDTVFYVHSMNWDVSNNEEENSTRFFETLGGYGVSNSKKTEVQHDGKVVVEDKNLAFNSLSQHFIVSKTAFHLTVTFEKRGEDGKLKALSEEDYKIAQKFFNSFQVVNK